MGNPGGLSPFKGTVRPDICNEKTGRRLAQITTCDFFQQHASSIFIRFIRSLLTALRFARIA
jgi:hypothetical protein